MEIFEVVDREKFDRAEYFYYFISTGTTIEFTVKTDVTKAIKTCKSNSLISIYLIRFIQSNK